MAVFSLPAEVNFANLMAVRVEGESHIDQTDPAEFDLSLLANGSSAVVALLIGWFRYAHAHGKVVRFLGVPVTIMNIIEVSDLGAVLPVAADKPGDKEGAQA